MGKKATGVFYRGTTNNTTLFKSVIFVKKKFLHYKRFLLPVNDPG